MGRRRGIALAAFLLLAGAAATALAAEADGQQASIDAGKTKAATCAACHGQTGNSVAPNWPNLAAQHPSYLVRELKAFKNGERQNPTMVGFASTLSEEDMRDLAAYFSSQTLIPKGADPKLVSQGQNIYRGGIPEKGVPACSGCHGPTGHGNYLAAYPRIAGQNQQYMLDTLKAFADGTRRSDPNEMMRNIASRMSQDELQAVTSYIQGLQQGNL
ncbi:MAG TPA: c-type cytochrome [Gammaproteobacteria bacterium]|nr:c-type cytochrome [Gammaproteobacteria bacterium]